MRLISATIKNYRVHKELRVDFDKARTLIGGPNESGKSTLIEAIHRALFFKAKAGGEVRKSMLSETSPGTPEVQVIFEADGKQYQLVKCFGGTKGTTTLAEIGGTTLVNEEAETRLADLLRAETVGGQGAEKYLSQQWAHLWTWQGQSGENPEKLATTEQEDLMRRLQTMDGATAVMQTKLDSNVARYFAEKVAETFTEKGDGIKKNTDLGQAKEKAVAAEIKLAAARERVTHLQQSVSDFEDASQAIARIEKDARTTKQSLDAARDKQNQVEELRRQETSGITDVEVATKAHTELAQTENRIAEMDKKIRDGDAALAPKNADVQRLSDAREELKLQAAHSVRAYELACESTKSHRLRSDLASAWVAAFEKKQRLDELSKKDERVRELQSSLAGLRQSLAKLPEINASALKKLQKLENELNNAETALQATAAGVDVLATDRAIVVGEKSLPQGSSIVVVEDTEISIGDGIRLRIRPGGGTSLSDARKNVHAARDALKKLLAESGAESVAAAGKTVARREELSVKIDKIETALESLDAQDVPDALAAARDASTAADALVERRAQAAGDFPAPSTLADANRLRDEADQLLREAEADERRAKLLGDADAKKITNAESTLIEAQQDIGKQTRLIDELRAQLRLLIETHGAADARAQAIAKAGSACENAQQKLARIKRAIDELQPDLLATDIQRLERVLSLAEASKKEAENKKAGAEALLRSDGADDPLAALEIAQTQSVFASERYAAEVRKADAMRLLHQLFEHEQRLFAKYFTQPFSDKIADYMRCMFGTGAKAEVRLDKNEFKDLELVRPAHYSGKLRFDSLSGGAKEQIAAAMRLAMAEILAADHGGCLPVVFDDAFAYSDPERVQILQRMLDLAASRGLQIIVLSCTPSDYAMLGARTITLQPPKPGMFSPIAESVAQDVSHDDEDDESSERISSQPPPDTTPEQREQFLAALRDLGGKAGNVSLRQKLAWDEVVYEAVKGALVSSGTVMPGRGRGGSVALPGVQ